MSRDYPKCLPEIEQLQQLYGSGSARQAAPPTSSIDASQSESVATCLTCASNKIETP